MQSIVINLIPPSATSIWDTVVKWGVLIVSGLFVGSTFFLTYRYNLAVRAGDLVLKLEESFTRLGVKLAFLEYKKTCYDGDVQRILQQSIDAPDSLKKWEREILEHLDECIRFLYICTLLAGKEIPANGAGGIRQFFFPSGLVPRAYYFYLDKLNDIENERKELRAYIMKYFPLLEKWLSTNKDALASYTARYTKPVDDQTKDAPQHPEQRVPTT